MQEWVLLGDSRLKSCGHPSEERRPRHWVVHCVTPAQLWLFGSDPLLYDSACLSASPSQAAA